MAQAADTEGRVWAFTGSLAVAASVAGFFWHTWTTAPLGILIFFLALNLAAEAFPVHLPFNVREGTVAVASACFVAEILIFAPFVAALLACAGSIRPHDLMRKVSLRAFIFNRAQIFLSVLLAAMIFHTLGGASVVTGDTLIHDLVPLIIAGITFSTINLAASGTYLGLLLSKSVRSIWRTDLSFAWANYLGNVLLGLLMIASYVALGVVGPVLFFAPLLFSRWTMQRFVQIREAYLDVVATLVNALEAKDTYTAGHSVRVADLAVELGEHIRLSDKDLDALYFTSILHDIGKIAIPDGILKKTGVYLVHEYLVMQQHPQIGENIVQHLRFLGKAVRWVGTHHERWDGEGFPSRIAGNDIPLGARIISVVDTYDAITSDRPYRKGASADVAYAEIARASGTQFDARVALAFLRLKRAPISEALWAHVAEETERVGALR